MRITSNTLHIILVLLFLPKEYRGTKCYQCNSKKDNDCSLNSVDPKYLKSCPPTHHYCRKYVYKYYFTDSKEYSTTRECAKWRNTECYRGRFPADSYQLTCECEGSGCNSTAKADSRGYLYIISHLVVLLLVNYT